MTQRLALVSGGMGGIGSAICKTLSQAGFRLVTTTSQPGKESGWLAAMQQQGLTDIQAYHCDVSDAELCQRMVAHINKEMGPISILVNNAGITRDGTFHKMTVENWQLVLRTNLDSVFNMTRPVIENMLAQQWGRVINISSINGQKGQFGQTNYSASKAGMHGFSMALAQEVARKNITVNTVSPGYIATDMVLSLPNEVREKIIANTPIGRLGTPAEVAALVAFLASDEAGYITGANIAINGGQYMQ